MEFLRRRAKGSRPKPVTWLARAKRPAQQRKIEATPPVWPMLPAGSTVALPRDSQRQQADRGFPISVLRRKSALECQPVSTRPPERAMAQLIRPDSPTVQAWRWHKRARVFSSVNPLPSTRLRDRSECELHLCSYRPSRTLPKPFDRPRAATSRCRFVFSHVIVRNRYHAATDQSPRAR